MNAKKSNDRLYSREDLARTKQIMLDSLAKVSGGTLIPGCCTQGCCDDEAQALIGYQVNLSPPPYTKSDIINAKRAMLSELAEISGGVLLAGCCTQGCCDPDAFSSVINVP